MENFQMVILNLLNPLRNRLNNVCYCIGRFAGEVKKKRMKWLGSGVGGEYIANREVTPYSIFILA